MCMLSQVDRDSYYSLVYISYFVITMQLGIYAVDIASVGKILLTIMADGSF